MTRIFMNILTSEDLDSKSDAAEQARFDYSPLGKVFNKKD